MKDFIKRIFSKTKQEKKKPAKVQYHKNPYELEIILDGEYIYFDDEDGSLLVKNFKDGKLNGPSYFHYLTGELWIEAGFIDGLEHGISKYFNKDGSFIKKEIWKNGKYLGIDDTQNKYKSLLNGFEFRY